MIDTDFNHRCPRCGDTKISPKVIEHCDNCHGVDNSIMTMELGHQVFIASYTAGDYSHLDRGK